MSKHYDVKDREGGERERMKYKERSDTLVYSGDCILYSHFDCNGSAEILRRTTEHVFDMPHKIPGQPTQGIEASLKIILTNVLHSRPELVPFRSGSVVFGVCYRT
jgi:hypothetical protein